MTLALCRLWSEYLAACDGVSDALHTGRDESTSRINNQSAYSQPRAESEAPAVREPDVQKAKVSMTSDSVAPVS